MIAEIKFKNMFSFRDETVLSFEADKSKDLESYHVVELAPDVKLLKLRSEEHTSELQSRLHLVCRLLLEKTRCWSELRCV